MAEAKDSTTTPSGALGGELAKMRKAVDRSRAGANSAIATAAYLYYRQEPPVPKSIDKPAILGDRVYSILVGLATRGLLDTQRKPHEVRKKVLPRYKQAHPGQRVPSARVVQNAYARYCADHVEK
jgi:hypothetical protein